ncbi:MAG: hypothetical protein FVQ84_12415 [Planctomycetes bacterium]|nr:hypothetical protein [Planctomycetota bacterium]
MDYRKGKEQTLKELYVQPGLGDALTLPADLRPQYLSLVLRIPIDHSQKLIRKAIDWTNDLSHHSFYIQRHDTLHITLVDIGRAWSFQSSLQEFFDKLNQFLKKSNPPQINITLEKAKIGSSGINCELLYDEKLDDWISSLGKSLSVGVVKKLKARSISLIRYRTQSDKDWYLIRQHLATLESVDADFDEKVSFDELSLVRLDKVAQYFDVLHTFKV